MESVDPSTVALMLTREALVDATKQLEKEEVSQKLTNSNKFSFLKNDKLGNYSSQVIYKAQKALFDWSVSAVEAARVAAKEIELIASKTAMIKQDSNSLKSVDKNGMPISGSLRYPKPPLYGAEEKLRDLKVVCNHQTVQGLLQLLCGAGDFLGRVLPVGLLKDIESEESRRSSSSGVEVGYGRRIFDEDEKAHVRTVYVIVYVRIHICLNKGYV